MANDDKTDPKKEQFFSLMDEWADRRESKNDGDKGKGDKDGDKGDKSPVTSFLDSMFGKG